MDVIKLLECKNRWLLSLFNYSERFYLQVQCGDFELIGQYERHRHRIDKSLSTCDELIYKNRTQLLELKKDPRSSKHIENLVEYQKRMIEKIFKVNENIIKYIEIKKLELCGELTKSDQQKKTLGKFRSTWVPTSGTGLDGQL